jgi:hypothetical protein
MRDRQPRLGGARRRDGALQRLEPGSGVVLRAGRGQRAVEYFLIQPGGLARAVAVAAVAGDRMTGPRVVTG